jgi:AhpD family alkylhydroperoxidase
MSKRLDYSQIAPTGIKALGGVYGYVKQSGLSPVLELAYLRVSQISNCAYCPRNAHVRPAEERREGRKAGAGTGIGRSRRSV